MKKTTAEKLAELSGAALISGPADNTVSRVERDSRAAAADSLFVGLVGEKSDGSAYAESAYEKGCRTFLLTAGKYADQLARAHADAAVLSSADTLVAMQRLAKNYLATCPVTKLAVTGSTGKTSTKEMLQCIFASKYRTVSNYENYNNHIGVPLTVFNVEADTEVAIFEMGMNHRGEIDLLADIVRPETAAITNVGISHIGNLGSRENILSAKLEITNYMNEGCTLVYNYDNDMLCSLAAHAAGAMCGSAAAIAAGAVSGKDIKLIAAGESLPESAGAGNLSGEGIRILDIRDRGDGGVDFKLESMGVTQEFHVPLPGRHNAWNAALAVGCALKYDISLAECAEALKNLTVTGNRLNIKEHKGVKVINDTYNASPDSVKAAIDVLTALDCSRRVAMLADMFELGDGSDDFHREVGAYAGSEGRVDLIIAIGENARFIAEGAKAGTEGAAAGTAEIMHFMTKEEFFAKADQIIRSGDGVLIKGSHGMHMDKVADYLLNL